VVSARPDNLDTCADENDGLDDGLSTERDGLGRSYTDFIVANGWGSLSAGALIGNVSTWIDANRSDSTYLRTVATAFREADASGAEVLFATDGEVAVALAAEGLDGGRADLTVTWSSALGGQMTTGFASDPVNAASGNFLEVEVDLGFGPTLRWLQVRRTYNSLDDTVGPFGPGWASWASTRLRAAASGRVAVLRGPDGQVVSLPLPPGTAGNGSGSATAGPVPGFEGRIVRDDATGGLVARFPRDGSQWRFDAVGRPVEIDDGPGTQVALS
jgi:hypothetical protein